MDNSEILESTLNATLQRHSRIVQNYEVEIANMTAQVIRLQSEVERLNAEAASKPADTKTQK